MSCKQDSTATAASQPFRSHYAEFDDSDFQIGDRMLFFIAALCSVIILVAFLFLYARRVFLFAYPSTADSFDSVAARMTHAPPRGLDAAAINSLPIVLHKSTASDTGGGEGECCICLGIFGDVDKVKVLPNCHHCFHSECVDKWLTTQSSCPICRASLRVDSPVYSALSYFA